MSCLPLAMNQIEIQRGMTTSSTAIFVPFTTQELFQNGKEAIYYGLNALSNNLIMVDRKKLKNPNGLILGTPGSGKSFSAKREITNAFLVSDDDIIVCDPEAEYTALVQKLQGQVVKISPSSSQFINPMDINANYSEEDNPIALKADFILSLCELVVGGKEGLQPVEKTVIDRCVHQIYQKYFEDPRPENMPILQDLYETLLAQEEKEARHVATALEIYVTGSLNLFNHRTNVDINNRFVCYDIKELGKQLKKIGMLVVQDQVWGRVTANRSAGKATRYYMDEFHLLLKEEQTAAYSVEIWKRFRKWGGIPTGITQNVKDLLSSREVQNIFENSDFIIMLNQASGDRQILASQLNISPHQLSYVTQSGDSFKIGRFANVMKYSMYKTFACKYKSNVHEIKRRYCRNDLFTVAYETRQGTKTTTFYRDGYKRKECATKFDNVSELPQFSKYAKTNTLKQRVERHTCELCQKDCRNLVIHQVKKLKDLKGNAEWVLLMRKRRRKTLVVCPECHNLIHS